MFVTYQEDDNKNVLGAPEEPDNPSLVAQVSHHHKLLNDQMSNNQM